MAIYSLQTKSIKRSEGRSAIASSAYRAGVKLCDERTGNKYDFCNKKGVLFSEVLGLNDKGEVVTNIDREQLWNKAEFAEKRKDARTAREWIVALPCELDDEQREELTRLFCVKLIERYGVAVDVAIHAPSKEGDERNYHAHVLCTTRRVIIDKQGNINLNDKADIELSDTKRRNLGLDRVSEEIKEVRKAWEDLANKSLELAGSVQRIDCRSYKERGIEQEPSIHMGVAATAMERKGVPTCKGDINRAIKQDNKQIDKLENEISELENIKDVTSITRDVIAKTNNEIVNNWNDVEKNKIGNFGVIVNPEEVLTNLEQVKIFNDKVEDKVFKDIRYEAEERSKLDLRLTKHIDKYKQIEKLSLLAKTTNDKAINQINVWRSKNKIKTWLHEHTKLKSKALIKLIKVAERSSTEYLEYQSELLKLDKTISNIKYEIRTKLIGIALEEFNDKNSVANQNKAEIQNRANNYTKQAQEKILKRQELALQHEKERYDKAVSDINSLDEEQRDCFDEYVKYRKYRQYFSEEFKDKSLRESGIYLVNRHGIDFCLNQAKEYQEECRQEELKRQEQQRKLEQMRAEQAKKQAEKLAQEEANRKDIQLSQQAKPKQFVKNKEQVRELWLQREKEAGLTPKFSRGRSRSHENDGMEM